MAQTKRIYVIETITNGVHKLSQEAYISYNTAKKFIENRIDKPILVAPFWFKSDDTEYLIHEILVCGI